MRILYFGMFGSLSTEPLRAILEHEVAQEITWCGIIVPAAKDQAGLPVRLDVPPPTVSDLPILNAYVHQTIVHLGWQHQIPVWEVGSLKDAASERLIRDLQPDLICVACFPRIFPSTILHIPDLGCLNLHPSLLPDYRGPEPLFWIAHQGETHTGVTLHFLAEKIDSGDIVAQTEFDFPEGMSEGDRTLLCAKHGAASLINALQQAQTGPLPRTAQPEGGRYFPMPKWTDLEISNVWSAQRAFRFLRGANTWPLKIKAGGVEILVDTALEYLPEESLEHAIIFKKDEVWLQFTPGILKVRRK